MEMLPLWKWMISVALDTANHNVLQACCHKSYTALVKLEK